VSSSERPSAYERVRERGRHTHTHTQTESEGQRDGERESECYYGFTTRVKQTGAPAAIVQKPARLRTGGNNIIIAYTMTVGVGARVSPGLIAAFVCFDQ